MPSIMANEPEKDPIFVMNSLSEQTQAGRYFSSESLEDRHSTTSSTESNPSLNVAHRKDHEFIPTRMKTISASKPAADPTQFTRVTSNPLLISAQKQLMKVEEVKKKKEIIPKRGDDEPDWQSNLSSWKDRRRKQSEEALQRVAEVKALEDEGDDINQRQKLSIGKKLSTLMYTSGDDDWSDLGLEREPRQDQEFQQEPQMASEKPKKHRQSLPTNLSKIEDKEEVQKELEETTDLVRSLSRNPQGGLDGYGEGVPVLNRKTSAPVLPYGSPRAPSEEKEPPPVRRKSSELSSSMKSRLEAFTNNQNEDTTNKRVVEPDNTFRQKLQNFRKISEPQPEPEQPQGPKPKLSYKNLIGNNFSESNARTLDNNDHEENVDDDVDQLLDDALEESYREIENTGTSGTFDSGPSSPANSPPTEKPPPPPTEEENAKNKRNLEHSTLQDQDLDKQEQEIIASLELEEREHKKYMDRRALSPQSVSPALSSDSSKAKKQPQQPQQSQQQQQQQQRSSYNQHWLIQEAEQRRISEQQMRYQQQPSPVYENSNYIGGMPQMPAVPPPSQYTNHQRPPPPPAPTGSSGTNGLSRPPQQPSPNENMYANLGQHPPLPSNYQREIPPGPPTSSNNMRGLPGPQVPPRNTHTDGTSPKGGSSDRLLSVSGKKKCSHCGEELGRGAAMIIESLRLFYHLRCFKCVVCHVQLGNGSTGTDVRVRNNKLHCQNCYSNDEGLKFSKV